MNCHDMCLVLNPEGVVALERALHPAMTDEAYALGPALSAFFDECEERPEDRNGWRLYEWHCITWEPDGAFARWLATLPDSTFSCIRVNENNYLDVDWQGGFEPDPFALTLRQYIDYE